MNNQNKNPIWITIPEKETESSKIFPDKKIPIDPDKVTNKVFWGGGFAALLVFSLMLIMPDKFSALIHGDLFDGNFQVIPDAQDQQGGAFFGGVSDTQNDTTNQTTETPTVSNPQNTTPPQNDSEAVPVQVNPINPPTTPTPETSTEETAPSQENSSGDAELQALLQNLSTQLEELKKDSLKKDQEIQSLTETLEQQALHEAAKPDPVVTSNPTNPSTSTPVVQNTGDYRANTHTVLVNPRDILAQNKMPAQAIQQTQASITQANPSSNNNASLSGVNSQPTTGPMDGLMIAFLLSALAMLGFGIFKNLNLSSKC